MCIVIDQKRVGYFVGKQIENGWYLQYKLENHPPPTRDLQAFLLLSQHASCSLLLIKVTHRLFMREMFITHKCSLFSLFTTCQNKKIILMFDWLFFGKG